MRSASRALVSAAEIELRSTRNSDSVICAIAGSSSAIVSARMRSAGSGVTAQAKITGAVARVSWPMAIAGRPALREAIATP